MRKESHNPIANLATALKKWIDDENNHHQLALALTRAKDNYLGTRTGSKGRISEFRQWPYFSKENALLGFRTLLSTKENKADPAQHDGWNADGHLSLGLTNLFGCASLNVLIMEQVILSFQERAKSVLECDEENRGRISREEYLSAYRDLDKGVILPQGNAQEIYNSIVSIWKDEGVIPSTPRQPSLFDRPLVEANVSQAETNSDLESLHRSRAAS